MHAQVLAWAYDGLARGVWIWVWEAEGVVL